MNLSKINCPDCGGKLYLKQTCQRVKLCCRSCGAMHDIEKFADLLDEIWETALANFPCDRL